MRKINGRTYIGNSNVYLTERGENALAITQLIVGLIVILLITGLVNVNLLTPEKCRDGILDIKDTEACQIYRFG